MKKGFLFVLTVMLLLSMFVTPVFAAENTELSIQNANRPSAAMMQGTIFQPQENITSNYPLKNIFVTIYDTNGNLVRHWIRCRHASLVSMNTVKQVS